jgi:hypothetical protein
MALERLRSRGSELTLIAFVIVAGVAGGFIAVRSAKLGALAVAALVMVLLVSRRPVVLGVVTVAGVYAAARLGSTSATPGSGGISYSDALVAAATVMALPALTGTSELRRLRGGAAGGIAVYLALLLPGLMASPSTRAYLEWTHRLVMVGGALLVGAWLVRDHAARTALRLLTAVSVIVALLAVQDTLTHGLRAAAPIGLNKNFVGSLFAAVLIVLLAAAPAIHIAPALRIGAAVVVAAGLGVSQSRGAELGAVLGVLVALLLDGKAHGTRLKLFATLIAAALAIVAAVSIKDQLSQNKAELNNSSAGVRFNVEHVTQDIWRTSPVVGVGLKYFNTGDFGPLAAAPNNVIDNELAESGLIGALGFVLFQVMTFAAAYRRRATPLVAAAAGAVCGLLLHGMVDIYWSAGVVTLPFLLLGMALASPSPAPGAARASTRRAIGAHRAG